jgi:hypothetical protein
MSQKNYLKISSLLFTSLFLFACATKTSKSEGSAQKIPNTEDIIIQDSSDFPYTTSSSSSSSEASKPPAETQKTVRTASVWIDAIGTDAYMALGFLQELEKHVEIVSVNGVGFGCWIAMSWAVENRGSYAEWQSFKWDTWDVLGSNVLNRVIGRSNADSFRSRLESRLPMKNRNNYKIPMACPFVYANKKDFQYSQDLAAHEELWIQMRNTFFFPLEDIEKDERRSGFFRGPVQPNEFVKLSPSGVKSEDHVWIVLSSEIVRREMRRGPQPEIQRGIIDDVRWVRKVLGYNDFTSLELAKNMKKKRAMLLKGRKEGKQFFENPAVSTFLGFGSALQ